MCSVSLSVSFVHTIRKRVVLAVQGNLNATSWFLQDRLVYSEPKAKPDIVVMSHSPAQRCVTHRRSLGRSAYFVCGTGSFPWSWWIQAARVCNVLRHQWNHSHFCRGRRLNATVGRSVSRFSIGTSRLLSKLYSCCLLTCAAGVLLLGCPRSLIFYESWVGYHRLTHLSVVLVCLKSHCRAVAE